MLCNLAFCAELLCSLALQEASQLHMTLLPSEHAPSWCHWVILVTPSRCRFMIVYHAKHAETVYFCHANECLSTSVCMSVWRGAGAEAGELVLKQQEQLAALARQHRRQPPSTPDSPNETSEHVCTDDSTNDSTDMTADTSKPTDQATDSVADGDRLEVSIQPHTLLCLFICLSVERAFA